MKKYLYFFIAGLLSLNLLACNPVNGNMENTEDTDKTGEITDTEESKKEGYEILVGTKWNLDTNEEYNEETLETAPKTITFKKDEIIIDDDEEILVTMPELKYVHHVKEIKINPLNTENDVIEGVVIIGRKYS